MRKAVKMRFREVRRALCSLLLSAQHRGDRAQHRQELSAGELDWTCAQHWQEPQGTNQDAVQVQLGIC